jgi:hypothetical protein
MYMLLYVTRIIKIQKAKVVIFYLYIYVYVCVWT